MPTSNPGGKVGIQPYSTSVEIKWENPEEFYTACVGAGWVPLLLKLTEKLFYLGWDGRLLQVKEKFGTLRFYWCNNIPGLAGEIAEDVVSRAEISTEQICEECGEYGKLRAGGWLVTLCGKHWKERQNRKEQDALHQQGKS
jgi:hypothetical protein